MNNEILHVIQEARRLFGSSTAELAVTEDNQGKLVWTLTVVSDQQYGLELATQLGVPDWHQHMREVEVEGDTPQEALALLKTEKAAGLHDWFVAFYP